MATRQSKRNGFTKTSQLLAGQIRSASQGRGFSESKLLTHWSEIVGEQVAAIARPVEVSYGRQGLGATLTLLTTGSQAPMLEMQKDSLREKVNAVYGYNAITRIRITQTARHGFSEGRVDFAPKRPTSPDKTPAPGSVAHARDTAADVADDTLRMALTQLGAHILDKEKKGNQT